MKIVDKRKPKAPISMALGDIDRGEVVYFPPNHTDFYIVGSETIIFGSVERGRSRRVENRVRRVTSLKNGILENRAPYMQCVVVNAKMVVKGDKE